MIRVTRPNEAPDVLLTRGADEQEAAHDAWTAHLVAVAEAEVAGDEVPKKSSFKFAVYKNRDVKALLVEMFSGKCAYCESFYSSTQPMDVEHFRPKGAVDKEPDHPGYYWVAGTWENLLPSCIDCNRRRTQEDVELDETVKVGKKDSFPVVDGTRAMDRDASLDDEEPMLVNPCTDNPQTFFRFDHALGVVVPKTKSGVRHRRARASIEIYGLNRSGLVTDRLHVLRMIDHHLEVVRLLTEVREGLDGTAQEPLVSIVNEVIRLELRALFDLRSPERPYSGLAKQLIEDLTPDLEEPDHGGD